MLSHRYCDGINCNEMTDNALLLQPNLSDLYFQVSSRLAVRSASHVSCSGVVQNSRVSMSREALHLNVARCRGRRLGYAQKHIAVLAPLTLELSPLRRCCSRSATPGFELLQHHRLLAIATQRYYLLVLLTLSQHKKNVAPTLRSRCLLTRASYGSV